MVDQVELDVVEEKTPHPASPQEGEEKMSSRRRKPKRKVKDRVRVRFRGEHGMLAGQAVFMGEVHEVMWYQYLEARKTGGDLYELVE